MAKDDDNAGSGAIVGECDELPRIIGASIGTVSMKEPHFRARRR